MSCITPGKAIFLGDDFNFVSVMLLATVEFRVSRMSGYVRFFHDHLYPSSNVVNVKVQKCGLTITVTYFSDFYDFVTYF